MEQRITDVILENVGILSKLEINGENKEVIRQGLEEMLLHIDKLNEIDTADVSPLGVITGDGNVFREEGNINPDMRDDILKNAPEQRNGMFVVPKTFD